MHYINIKFIHSSIHPFNRLFDCLLVRSFNNFVHSFNFRLHLYSSLFLKPELVLSHFVLKHTWRLLHTNTCGSANHIATQQMHVCNIHDVHNGANQSYIACVSMNFYTTISCQQLWRRHWSDWGGNLQQPVHTSY